MAQKKQDQIELEGSARCQWETGKGDIVVPVGEVAWLGRGGEKDGAEEEGMGKVVWLDPDP